MHRGPDPLVEGLAQVADIGLQDLARHEGAGQHREVVDVGDVGERLVDGLAARHVRRAPAIEAVLGGDLPGAVPLEADDDDLGTGGLGLDGGREADARRAAEDDDGAAFELRRWGCAWSARAGLEEGFWLIAVSSDGARTAPARTRLDIQC